MITFLQMQSRCRDDLMASTSSTLFTTERIKDLLKEAHLWATALYSFPALEKARVAVLPSVFGGDQYMDYPTDYRTDTMAEFIYVDGKAFKRIGWPEFTEHIRLHPSSSTRLFADYGRQVFIYPHQTAGVEVILWGQVQATQLSGDSDETIFSRHDESGNQAIVDKAHADGIRNIDSTLADRLEQGAVTKLSIIWDKIAKRQQYAQPRNKAMFNVPDFFGGGGLSSYYGFNEEED